MATHPDGTTAKIAADANGLALPTTYHLLNTLVDEGLLAKAGNGRYVLGPSSATLARAYLRGSTVSEGLVRALHTLAVRTGETAYLADWGEHDIRVLASVEGSNLLRVAEVASGAYDDAHARANGKVLLAYAWPELCESYLRRHPPRALTQSTICDLDSLHQELELVRERGYAYDEEEFAEGVSCIAAPVLDHDQIIASIGLLLPTERFAASREELTEIVVGLAGGLAEADLYDSLEETAS